MSIGIQSLLTEEDVDQIQNTESDNTLSNISVSGIQSIGSGGDTEISNSNIAKVEDESFRERATVGEDDVTEINPEQEIEKGKSSIEEGEDSKIVDSSIKISYVQMLERRLKIADKAVPGQRIDRESITALREMNNRYGQYFGQEHFNANIKPELVGRYIFAHAASKGFEMESKKNPNTSDQPTRVSYVFPEEEAEYDAHFMIEWGDGRKTAVQVIPMSDVYAKNIDGEDPYSEVVKDLYVFPLNNEEDVKTILDTVPARRFQQGSTRNIGGNSDTRFIRAENPDHMGRNGAERYFENKVMNLLSLHEDHPDIDAAVVILATGGEPRYNMDMGSYRQDVVDDVTGLLYNATAVKS